MLTEAEYRRSLRETFGIEWAAISELPEADRLAALTRIDELQGQSPRDRAWPTEGGNEPAAEPGWDSSGTFRPDVVRRVYEELKAAGTIK